MTAMTPAQKEWRKAAQARASQIRMGMRSYIETLGLIHIAWEQQDHLRLGYPSWEAYYNAEFSEERVQLTPEMRDKAITELRIAGMSQREIAASTGLSASTVNRHLNRVADETDILEGDIVPPARSSLVEAMTGAIEDAADRIETAGVAAPEERTDQEGGVSWARADPTAAGYPAPDSPGGPANPPGPAEAGATGAGPTPAPVADIEDSPSEVQRPGEPAGTGEPTENAGTSAVTDVPATSPAGPPCEKCGGEIEPVQDGDRFMRCATCDRDGEHVAGDDGECRLCAAIEAVDDAYLPLAIAEGPNGLHLLCTYCRQLVAHLSAGMPLPLVLVEADQHNCTP